MKFCQRLAMWVMICSYPKTDYSQIVNPFSFTFQPINLSIIKAPVNPPVNSLPAQPPNGITAEDIIRQNNANTMRSMGIPSIQVPPSDPYLRDQYIKQNMQQEQLRKQQEYLKEIYQILNENTQEFDPKQIQRLQQTKIFHDVFLEMQTMQRGTSAFSLKRCVFLIENAWSGSTIDYTEFSDLIAKKVNLVNQIAVKSGIESSNGLGYNYAIQKLFSEPVTDSQGVIHQPYGYDFEDFMGEMDWSKMFVTKLASTGKGQCHSLPLLYLILAEETNTKAWLSCAPEHSYIIFSDNNKKSFFNFETTNGNIVSTDWIMQSGYVNTQAIRNRIYLDTLSRDQLVSTLIADLVMGYINKFGYDEFVSTMVDYLLALHPKSIQGLIFKADLQVLKTQRSLKKAGNPPIENIQQYPEAYSDYIQLLRQYDLIDALGYIRMPKELYEKWLASANTQKQQTNVK